jgi:hypothetical protein
MSLKKFESNEIDGPIVEVGFNFYGFFERFNCFELSKFGYIEIILCIECVFPDVSTLCPFFELSLVFIFIFIAHCNVNFRFDFHFHFNSFCKNEVMIRTIKSLFLMRRNDGTDCDRFWWILFYEKQSESSFERKGHFYFYFDSSTFLIGMEGFFEMSDRGTESSKIEIFCLSDNENENKNENENIMSEMYEIRQLLRLSGGSRNKSIEILEIDDSVEIVGNEDFNSRHSLKKIIFSSGNHLREISGFQQCISLCQIEIPPSVEKIGLDGFRGCTSLNAIVFSSDGHLREIDGFCECTSLCRIEIPSSVETIGCNGFSGCTSLNAIVFSSGSHLKEISGFIQCASLCRIEIPSSVEMIRFDAFLRCTSLNTIIFTSDSHLREISGFCERTSLSPIEIPSSVEIIGSNGFRGCTSLRVLIIRTGCRIRKNEGLRNIKPFLVYEEEDMKKFRCLAQTGVGRRRIHPT